MAPGSQFAGVPNDPYDWEHGSELPYQTGYFEELWSRNPSKPPEYVWREDQRPMWGGRMLEMRYLPAWKDA